MKTTNNSDSAWVKILTRIQTALKLITAGYVDPRKGRMRLISPHLMIIEYGITESSSSVVFNEPT